MVAGSALAGVRLYRSARTTDEHRRRYLEATKAREHDLRILRVEETKFRTLISNIPGVAYRCADDADYTMEFISDAIAQLSGYHPADFVNNAVRTYGSIIHPEDVDAVARIVADG